MADQLHRARAPVRDVVKALSVRQPWASRIARGEKTVELRSWPTRYRGPLLIAAGARSWPGVPIADAPRGCSVALVDLVGVRLATAEDASAAGLEPPAGWYAWLLSNAREVEQIAIKGRLGLFEVPWPS